MLIVPYLVQERPYKALILLSCSGSPSLAWGIPYVNPHIITMREGMNEENI